MSGTTTDPTVSSAPSEATVTARYTYRYHADSLRLLSMLLLCIVLLLGLTGFYIFVQLSKEPKPLHFQLDQDLQIIAPVPLDQQGITTSALLNWVNELVMDAFSFNYSNMSKQQAKMSRYLSDPAMKIYLDFLTSDEDFSAMLNNKTVVAVSPKAAPEVVVAQTYQGRYVWQIEVPVRITFSNALMRSYQELVLDFLVWRVNADESPLGITVATFTRKVTSRAAPAGIRVGL